jgi:hypothetical protein
MIDKDEQRKDADTIEDFANWLRAEVWEIVSCGNSGKIEGEKIKEYAKLIIKIASKYL